MLQVEDFLEEMEASEELMEREKDGRYIAVAIVFGLFGFEEIGWKLKGLKLENCLVDGCLALKTVDCSDGEKDIVKRGA